MKAGLGSQIIPGVGHPFIMDAGSMNPAMAGNGSLITNGDRDGLVGVDRMSIMVGHR